MFNTYPIEITPLIAGYKRCDKNQFECSNRICISRDLECNGVDDCGDKSDEMSVCGEFNSSLNLCCPINSITIIYWRKGIPSG